MALFVQPELDRCDIDVAYIQEVRRLHDGP